MPKHDSVNDHSRTMRRSSKMTVGVLLLFFLAACAGPSRLVPTGAEKKAPSQSWKSDSFIVLKTFEPVSSQQLAEKYLDDRTLSWSIEDANGNKHFKAGDEIVIPLKDEHPLGLFPSSYQVVPILCYHRFGDDIQNRLIMPAKEFEKQMAYLKKHDYRVIPLSHVREFLYGKRALPMRSVAITIDDGYRSVYDVAFPILKKYGYPATIFIYTDYIDAGPGALSWENIREMEGSGLIDTESHTKTHADLNTVFEVGRDKVREELLVPIDLIARKLGHPALYLAYPYGRANSQIIRLSKEAGLEMGLTVNRGENAFFQDPWSLRRNMIFAGEKFEHFLENISIMENLKQ